MRWVELGWRVVRPTTRRTIAVLMLVLAAGRLGMFQNRMSARLPDLVYGWALLVLGIGMYAMSNGHRHRWYGILISTLSAGLLGGFGVDVGWRTLSGFVLLTMAGMTLLSLLRAYDDC